MSATVGNKKIKHVLGACKEGHCVIRENFNYIKVRSDENCYLRCIFQ